MKGTLLKEKAARVRASEPARSLAASRAGRAALEAGAWSLCALALAAPGLLGGPLPPAACLPLCVEGPSGAERWAASAYSASGTCRRAALGGTSHAFGRLCPHCGTSMANAAAALLGACGGYVLFWGWELAMEPLALALSCFAGAVIFRRTPVSRPALAAGLCFAVGALFLLDAGFGLLPLLRLAVGTGAAALTPRLHDRLGSAVSAGERETDPDRPRPLPAARAAEKALLTMHGVLAREDQLLRPVQLAEVYDFAAEQVCRCCVRGAQCWEENAEDTYRDLCAAGEAILRRGAALREDLPERFTARCRHTAGFVTAVNQALDEVLTRRREELRRAESRRVAAGQYLALQRLLSALSRPQPPGAPAFVPELAVGSACRVGSEISGDRGAVCRDRFGGFCLLLCDGMGTGPAARTESDRAARLLTALLETGLEPDTALELLNGFYVLRKETVFATLDLLRVDLRTGAGVLYKWGAAPSYLWRSGAVEEIGTATPPPGLEAARGRVPGQYELSLREGETLVMVSDGAWGEETARRLRAFAQGTVRDLAACLIARDEAGSEDDRTAAVLRLRPLDSCLQRGQSARPSRKAGRPDLWPPVADREK